MAAPTTQSLSLEFLASDSVYEREVLKLSDGETEEDLNRRLVQTAEDAGMSDSEIALCLGPHLVPAAVHTAPSIVSTAFNSPNSRGSLNTSSTAPTSHSSFAIEDPRMSVQSRPHKKNISIGSLFNQTRGQASLGSAAPTSASADADSSRRGKQHFTIRDVEISILNGKGLEKISRRFGFRKSTAGDVEPVPWQAVPSNIDPNYKAGGIRASVTGRIDLQQDTNRLTVDHSNLSSRAPSIHSEAGDRHRFRSRSAAFIKLKKPSSRRSFGGPTDLSGKPAWSQPGSSTNLASIDLERPLPALPAMDDESQDGDASIPMSAMLASSPYAEPEPVRHEMRDALKARAGLQVQSQNRTELRKLKAFRNKQMRVLEVMHDNERNKMLSVFDQQKELIDAKYRQALTHLIEDRQVVAELDLLAQLEDRLKREQGKLRHMEAYCSPTSGRIVTSQNRSLLDAQRSLVAQLQSEQYSTASLNHLREKQDSDAARLPKQQEVELEELEEKRRRAVLAREETEQREQMAINAVIRRRRDASVARCNLRLEVWRRRFETDAARHLPGPLPYFRSDFVFEARWMVDMPFRSALDDFIPAQRGAVRAS